MTAADEHALVLIACSVVETCRDMDPDGAPGGHLYAALMNRMNLHNFNDMMTRLVRMGLLEKRGDCYHYTGPSLEPVLGGGK